MNRTCGIHPLMRVVRLRGRIAECRREMAAGGAGGAPPDYPIALLINPAGAAAEGAKAEAHIRWRRVGSGSNC
jgi:hypothetical protein